MPEFAVIIAYFETDPDILLKKKVGAGKQEDLIGLVTVDGERLLVKFTSIRSASQLEANSRHLGDLFGPFRIFFESDAYIYVPVLAADLVSQMPQRVCSAIRGLPSAGGTAPKYYDDGGTVSKSTDDLFPQSQCGGTAPKYYDDGNTVSKSMDDWR